MTPELQQLRLRIFEHFLEHAAPPVVEELMAEFSLGRDDVTGALRELAAARHIALVPGTSRILMAFPFSAIATPFRVQAHGRHYFANCSWDAIAFHSMLDDEVRVDSACHHCGAPLEINLADGTARRVDPPDALVHLALPPSRWWDDIVTTCGNTMVFFASAEHRDASDLCRPADEAVSLTTDQVHALSGPIYARKLDLDYERPSRDELLAHFANIGLTGPYWQL